MDGLSTGKMARAARVSVDTVRLYERMGLIPSPPRSAAGYRRYRQEDLARLRVICRARAVGFSLADIATLLTSTTRSSKARALARRRRSEIERQIAELTCWRDALSAALSSEGETTFRFDFAKAAACGDGSGEPRKANRSLRRGHLHVQAN